MDILKTNLEEYRNKIVRVYIQSFSAINQQKFSLFIERLNSLTYSTEVFEVDDSLSGILDDSGVDFTSTNAVIEQYINDVVDNASIDKAKLTSIFMELYAEASESIETE